MKTRFKLFCVMAALALIVAAAGACAAPTPVIQTVKETVVVAGTPQIVERQVTAIVEKQVEKIITATPAPTAGPRVGGKITIVQSTDPKNLDPVWFPGGTDSWHIMQFLNGMLVHRDPKTGEYLPYLAESWESNADQTQWTFKLKKGVKFHNGDLLTAKDWVYTVQRAQDPNAFTKGRWPKVKSAEALDDYTLRLNLTEPYGALFWELSRIRSGPASKAAIEKAGDNYSRQPVGVGPFMFSEWVTGQRIVLKRNPDYNWGPSFTHGGPPYIETVEFRVIPEATTVLAGLEAGEIDAALIPSANVARFQTNKNVQILKGLDGGARPVLVPNVLKAPFTDLKVRQAFNLAVDRKSMIKLVAQGMGEVQYGPASARVSGYWPGVEFIGYGFDLPKAKKLMAEAGYADSNGDGILEKDGKPLKLLLKASTEQSASKAAQVLKEQLRQLGADITIQELEVALLNDQLVAGDFELSSTGYYFAEADILYLLFHSSLAQTKGGVNHAGVKDPEVDRLLDASRREVDPAKRQLIVNDLQRRLVEQAYWVPLFTQYINVGLSARLHGVIESAVETPSLMAALYYYDAWVEK